MYNIIYFLHHDFAAMKIHISETSFRMIGNNSEFTLKKRGDISVKVKKKLKL